MTAEERVRLALEAAVALDNEWWNAEHSDALPALDELVARAERLTELAQNVTTAVTAEAEDWNDGEYALWRKDDLLTAIYALRAEVGVRS